MSENGKTGLDERTWELLLARFDSLEKKSEEHTELLMEIKQALTTKVDRDYCYARHDKLNNELIGIVKAVDNSKSHINNLIKKPKGDTAIKIAIAVIIALITTAVFDIYHRISGIFDLLIRKGLLK